MRLLKIKLLLSLFEHRQFQLVWCVYALGLQKDSANTGFTSITLTVHESQKACLRESQLILELISFMCCKIYWNIKH